MGLIEDGMQQNGGGGQNNVTDRPCMAALEAQYPAIMFFCFQYRFSYVTHVTSYLMG